MEIKYAIISERGKRSINEDAVCVINQPEENRWLGLVCDGLGGHAMGEVASDTVIKAITQYYEQHQHMADVTTFIKEACKVASKKLNEKADQLGHIEMGTTMALAYIENDQLTIAHIGDSRCYLLGKNGILRHKTTDHTELRYGYEILSKCFFSYNRTTTEPEIIQFNISNKDRILICTDGLYKSIPPEILIARASDDKTPDEILDVFSFLCERNGDDNYSGILVFPK